MFWKRKNKPFVSNIDRTSKITGILSALSILDKKERELCFEPSLSVYTMVSHAKRHVDKELAEMLRGSD